MAEMVMTYLTKAQDLVPATYGYYALVSALCVVGLAKVAGVMAHPGSKLVGRAEICGAILLLMAPRRSMDSVISSRAGRSSWPWE